MQAAVSLFDGYGRPAVAGAIRDARSRLRARLIGVAVPAPPLTVLVDVLTEALIDRCAEAVADGDAEALMTWAETACRDRLEVPAVRGLLLGIGPALADVVGGPGFEALTSGLENLVQRLRSQQPVAGADTVDELDLLLAEMVGRVESNDPITAEHCRAVSAWSARIAHRLSLSRDEATFVARGGLIHDVGKSVTPHEILQAPRQLTAEEWVVMREHVITGHEILRENPPLREFAPIVRSHHEHFDGRGYPDQLDRARLPIAVRIVTVADAFNAMIGRRPYRRPLSPDRATFELRRCAGTQFDPNVVAALLDVVGGGYEPAFQDPAVREGALAC